MKTVQLSSWEDWQSTSTQLIEEIKIKKAEIGSTYSDLLFRGQACESWKLETTIERYINKDFTIDDYHTYLQLVLPAFSAYTEKMWELETNPPIDDMLKPPLIG